MAATDSKYPLICSICQNDIPEEPPGWREGNNAQPVNGGRCCNYCDAHVVIPARLARLKRGLPIRLVEV